MAQYILVFRAFLKCLCVGIVFLFFIPNSLADTLEGIVVKIADGDTLTLLTSLNQPVKIRLSEIDAPEKKQAFGTVSKQSLASLCFRKTAIVNYEKKDRYQRVLGRVYCNEIDANAEQVRRGMAWVYDRYVTDKNLYSLQLAAQQSKVGLWIDSDAIPPWEFRRLK